MTALEVQDDSLTGVQLRSGEYIPRQVVVVASRLTPRAAFLQTFGLETTNQEIGGQVVGSYIAADARGATSIPGVWVAGNLNEPFGQVIGAATSGLKAGAITVNRQRLKPVPQFDRTQCFQQVFMGLPLMVLLCQVG